jgi:kinase
VSLLLEVAAGFMYPPMLADSWAGNDPCHGWRRVGCNPNGSITGLTFVSMGLRGSISSAIGKFASLQRLILANNNINGTVPKEIAALPALTEVDLSNNNLFLV